MITKDEAWSEFNQLLNDDEDFSNMWKSKNNKEQISNFFEWCSLYDDTKFIKKVIPLTNYEIELPIGALWDCYHSGQCDEDVSTWYKEIDWSSVGITDEQIKKEVDNLAVEDLKTVEDYRKFILFEASARYHEQYKSEL